MSTIPVTIKGIQYLIPSPSAEAWGEDTTNLLIAIVDSLNSAASAGDIADNTEVIILNNQTTPIAVTNLVFDSAVTKSASIDYYVYRVIDSTEYAEVGQLRVVYKDISNTWVLDRTHGGDDAGVLFDINSLGQVTYTSSNLGAGVYSGVTKYRARSILP
jgi:hypothetical protein